MRICFRNVQLSLVSQITFLVLFWVIGEGMVRWMHLPIPGGIAGMLLVLALLFSGRLKVGRLRQGAEWFLAEMLLFFVPAALVVLDHKEFLGWTGLKILAVILFGTATVMSITAFAIDICSRWCSTGEDGRHVRE